MHESRNRAVSKAAVGKVRAPSEQRRVPEHRTERAGKSAGGTSHCHRQTDHQTGLFHPERAVSKAISSTAGTMRLPAGRNVSVSHKFEY